jgi:SEC-C motif-containing protein
MPTETPCPCGRTGAKGRVLPFADCCGRYVGHFDTTPAPDAPSLMRSRYTAFTLQDRDYLLATWHDSTRPATLDFESGAKWLGLQVRDAREVDATHAEVEFVARFRVAGRAASTGAGQAVRLHERSRFVREGGRWYYVDGDQR